MEKKNQSWNQSWNSNLQINYLIEFNSNSPLMCNNINIIEDNSILSFDNL